MDVFLGFVALVGIIILAYRKRSDGGETTLEDINANLDEYPPRRPPFNRRTARVQLPPNVISGSAYVVDGDTLLIKKTQIRLFGIDAPEIDHPYGQKAKWKLVSLCKGQTIRAEITETDAHNRKVAKCTLLDGRDLSAEMVKAGLAIDWSKFSGGIYRELEIPDVRKKLWLADARQKGRMHVWKQYEERKSKQVSAAD